MNGYQQRTEKKKEQILRTTFDLLSKYEIEKISIAEIAKLAKVSPVTLYNYFGSKDELIKVTLIDYMSKKLDLYEQFLVENIPFERKLEKILFDNEDTVNHINLGLFQTNINDTNIREIIEDFYEGRTLPFFQKLIETGKKDGFIEPGLSMEAIMLYIQMFKDVLARPGFIAQAKQPLLQELNQLLYFGLVGRRGSR